jgi:hypothetical protein
MKLTPLVPFFLVAFFLLPISSPRAEGEGGGGGGSGLFSGTQAKQQNVKKHRWTLAEWLATKERVRLMDQWLAMNTSSNPYEFYLGGDTISYDLTTTPAGGEDSVEPRRLTRGYFAMFAEIVGLEGQYEVDDKKYSAWRALFKLRLLGKSAQSTHLTLQYGLKNVKADEDAEGVQTQFAGARMALYLTKHFGIDGLYRYHLPYKSDQTGLEFKGERIEARGFIDFEFFQIYGVWLKESMRYESGVVLQSRQVSSGFGFGARLYF